VFGRWVRASFAGWALGFLLVLLLIAVSGVVGLGSTQFPVGLGMGLGVGAIQGGVTEPLGVRRVRWLRASALGLAAPFIVNDVLQVIWPRLPFSLPLLIALGGLLTGVLQWRLLRGILGRAEAWIVASVAGWSLAGTTVMINERFLPKIPGIVGALLYIGVVLAGGIALGAVGGLALLRLAKAEAAPVS
jgi:hypothetical protein